MSRIARVSSRVYPSHHAKGKMIDKSYLIPDEGAACIWTCCAETQRFDLTLRAYCLTRRVCDGLREVQCAGSRAARYVERSPGSADVAGAVRWASLGALLDSSSEGRSISNPLLPLPADTVRFLRLPALIGELGIDHDAREGLIAGGHIRVPNF